MNSWVRPGRGFRPDRLGWTPLPMPSRLTQTYADALLENCVQSQDAPHHTALSSPVLRRSALARGIKQLKLVSPPIQFEKGALQASLTQKRWPPGVSLASICVTRILNLKPRTLRRKEGNLPPPSRRGRVNFPPYGADRIDGMRGLPVVRRNREILATAGPIGLLGLEASEGAAITPCGLGR